MKPRNNKGERHGYWEGYYNGQLAHKGNWINGRQTGYWEYNHKPYPDSNIMILKSRCYYIL